VPSAEGGPDSRSCLNLVVRKAYSAEHRESLQSTKTRTSSFLLAPSGQLLVSRIIGQLVLGLFHLYGFGVNQDLGTLVCQSHKIPVVEDGEHGQHCKPTPEYKPICSLPPSVTSDSGEEHNLKDNGNDYQRFKHTSIFLLLSLDGQPIATFPISAFTSHWTMDRSRLYVLWPERSV
jgi:hypothetical protein